MMIPNRCIFMGGCVWDLDGFGGCNDEGNKAGDRLNGSCVLVTFVVLLAATKPKFFR
jgi:hypothetical protein